MDAVKNFAYSLVATPPSPAASGTSLVVSAGGGANFPAAPFNAIIAPAGALPLNGNAEIVRVTAKSTDTFTITRTQEGSSARTITAGDQVYVGVTAKVITDLVNRSPLTAAENTIQSAADIVPLTVKSFAGQTVSVQEWRDSAGLVLASVMGAQGADSAQSILVGAESNPTYFKMKLMPDADPTKRQPFIQMTYSSLSGYGYSEFNFCDGPNNPTFAIGAESNAVGGNRDVYFYDTPGSKTFMFMKLADYGRITMGAWAAARAQVDIRTQAASFPGLIVQAAASQSANIQEWQKSDGSVIGSFSPAGKLAITTAAGGSAGALQLTNTGAGDTTGLPLLQGFFTDGTTETCRISATGYFFGAGVRAMDSSVYIQLIPGSRVNLVGGDLWMDRGKTIKLVSPSGVERSIGVNDAGLVQLPIINIPSGSWGDGTSVSFAQATPAGVPSSNGYYRWQVAALGQNIVNISNPNAYNSALFNAAVMMTLIHDNFYGTVTGGDALRVCLGDDTTAANIKARILKTGAFVTRQNAAPADADLSAGEMSIWYDQTNGASKLMVKAKQADGTVKTGQIALA